MRALANHGLRIRELDLDHPVGLQVLGLVEVGGHVLETGSQIPTDRLPPRQGRGIGEAAGQRPLTRLLMLRMQLTDPTWDLIRISQGLIVLYLNLGNLDLQVL